MNPARLSPSARLNSWFLFGRKQGKLILKDSEERPEVIIIFPLSRFRIRDFHLVSASSRAVGS